MVLPSLTPYLASLCSTAGRKFYASLGRQGPIHGPDARQDRPEGRARPWGTSTSIGSSQRDMFGVYVVFCLCVLYGVYGISSVQVHTSAPD